MPFLDLNRSLAWTRATDTDAAMLDQLQPNIVRPHVRESLRLLLLRFHDRDEALDLLRRLVERMKSAHDHLREVEAYKQKGEPGTPYLGLGLTRSGYRALGVPDRLVPPDQYFAAGMKATRRELNDPPSTAWEEAYRGEIHAVVLIGDGSEGAVAAERNVVLGLFPDDEGVVVLGEERGTSRRNADGDGIEHFGYIDGLSQPLFLDEDVAEEIARTSGRTVWDPRFDLSRVLVPDTAAPDPNVQHGSYLVYRKLEQNVRLFKQAEEDLADALGLAGDERERAGAMLVGRFGDGTSLTLSAKAGLERPATNNFTYNADATGLRCPVQSHVRKMNPRGSAGPKTLAEDRDEVMARRGQTYGDRQDPPGAAIADLPASGVGVLFMACNADIGQQFLSAHFRRADRVDFPALPNARVESGLDPVIGNGVRSATALTRAWGQNDPVVVPPVPPAVDLKGGEYFFLPSLAFLGSL